MAIPTPIGTDPPCEFAEDWCNTAAAINVQIAAYQQTLARVYPAIPVALLRLTETVTIGSLTPFPFTEVVFDTFGMTDLDADPTAINIKRSGRYTIRGWLRTNSTGVVNTIIDARISTNIPPAVARDGIVLDRATVALGNGTFDTVSTLIAGTTMQLLQATGGALTVTFASLCVAWHSDQERPV